MANAFQSMNKSVEQDHPRNKQVAVKDSKELSRRGRKELESCTIAVLCPTYMTDVKEVYRHASSSWP
jgi:hypothetical protein